MVNNLEKKSSLHQPKRFRRAVCNGMEGNVRREWFPHYPKSLIRHPPLIGIRSPCVLLVYCCHTNFGECDQTEVSSFPDCP